MKNISRQITRDIQQAVINVALQKLLRNLGFEKKRFINRVTIRSQVDQEDEFEVDLTTEKFSISSDLNEDNSGEMNHLKR